MSDSRFALRSRREAGSKNKGICLGQPPCMQTGDALSERTVSGHMHPHICAAPCVNIVVAQEAYNTGESSPSHFSHCKIDPTPSHSSLRPQLGGRCRDCVSCEGREPASRDGGALAFLNGFKNTSGLQLRSAPPLAPAHRHTGPPHLLAVLPFTAGRRRESVLVHAHTRRRAVRKPGPQDAPCLRSSQRRGPNLEKVRHWDH